MTVFGRHWDEHWPKIRESWQTAVTADDTVIICGDTSWAMQLEEAVADLDELAALPATRYCCAVTTIIGGARLRR
jgi:predicted phosphohydrolase